MPSLRLLLCTFILAGALVGLVHSTASAASRVLVMDRHGAVHERVDHALPPDASWPADLPAPPARAAAAAAARRRPAARSRTVRSELKRLLADGQLDDVTHSRYRRMFDTAVATGRRLTGARRNELLGVIDNLHAIAERGQLTPTRLPALFTTLERNRQWWTTGRLLSYGQRVEFSDSELVWQSYPGEGIQLQVLGTFGKANGLWMARDTEGLRALLDEMIPLAAQRGTALAWEYYFDFGGGVPPWTSGMSQATGIQALSRASQALHDPAYLDAAKRALPLFSLAPPTGVRVATPAGARYLIYSFSPGQAVVNAFVQTLVGLYDYGQISGDPAAGRLFRAGDRQARLDVSAADTGAWSLYQLGGAESDLGYHTLLRDFLRNICDRTATEVYCTTAANFTRDLREPPVLTLPSQRFRVRRQVLVRFDVSKISRVGLTIRDPEGATVLSTSASVARGRHAYAWRVPPRAGTYEVVLSGTDLAGNFGRMTGTIEVLGRRPPV